MSTAFLFPGQGLELAAHLSAWYRASPVTRHLLDVAADQLEMPMTRLMHGAGVALRSTHAYQPALVALCTGIMREVETRVGLADYAVGHSLGELAACVAAGMLADTEAVCLAAHRGRLMAREAARHPGGMLALHCTAADAELAVGEAMRHGTIGIAAYNAPDQQVISGMPAALRAIAVQLHSMPVATEGAWHSSLMQDAMPEYRELLCTQCQSPGRAHWIPNRTGVEFAGDDDAVSLLAGQLTKPVQWVRTMDTLRSVNLRVLFTLGPTRTQRTLARRAIGDALCIIPVEHPDDLGRIAEAA